MPSTEAALQGKHNCNNVAAEVNTWCAWMCVCARKKTMTGQDAMYEAKAERK